MPTDPLTASYLATVPEAPTIQDLQAKRNALQQQGLTIQHLAGQVAIQKQMRAENDYKLQAAAKDRQDEETYNNALSAEIMKRGRSTAPVSTSGQTEDQELGTAGAVAAPVATTQPSVLPPEQAALEAVRPQLAARNALRIENEYLDHRKVVASLTKDEIENHTLNNQQIGAPIFAAVDMEDQPAQQEALYQQASRTAKAKGVDTSGWLPTLPPDPKARQKYLEGLAKANGYEKSLLEWARQQKAEEDAQRLKQDEDRKQIQSDKQGLAAQLANAPDGETHNALLATADPKVALGFQKAPTGPLSDDFKTQQLDAALPPVERAKIQRQRMEDAAKQKAADAKQAAADAAAELKAGQPTPEDRDLLRVIGAKDPNNPTHDEMLKMQAEKIRLKQAERPVTNNYAAMTPDQRATTARAIANGKMNPDSVRRTLNRNPELLADILAADPNFDEADIDKRYNTLKEFTNTSNSKAGGQLLALNTLVHHADLYLQTADALKNGDFKPGNAVYNAVATMFGSAPPTQANLVAQFLAGETGKVATGGVPAEGEINRILKSLGSDAGPDQIKGAADSLLGIASGRMIPLKERVEDSKLGNVVQVLGPDAKAILSKQGYDTNTLKKTGGASASAPPLPATLTAADKGKTFTNRDGKKLKITDVNPANGTQFKYDEVQ